MARAFEVVIKESWCKGCNICVAMCPKEVLELRSFKAVVARPEACIGCYTCELLCPDFAVTVREVELSPTKDGAEEQANG